MVFTSIIMMTNHTQYLSKSQYSFSAYTIIYTVNMLMRLRFRDLREDRDMSQAEMAKLLHCSQQTYSRYESHTTEIPLESLVFLAEYYETSVDYLLGLTDCAERYSPNKQKGYQRSKKAAKKTDDRDN